MKFCPECGSKQPDAAQRCPNDRQPLIALAADPEAATTARPGGATFNVQLYHPLERSGTYQVFVRDSDLFFIRTDAASGPDWLGAVLVHLGPVGALLSGLTWLASRRQSRHLEARLNNADPEELVRTSRRHFKLHVFEIRDAVLRPLPFWAITRTPGLFILQVRAGEKIQLGFRSVAEMKTALFFLVRFLRSVFRLEAEWDEARRRFRKPGARR